MKRFLFISCFILLTGCGSCGEGRLFESDIASEKRELCESTGGVASKVHDSCSQHLEGPIRCEEAQDCPQVEPSGRPKAILCTCPPGEVYDNQEGCRPHLDPVCVYVEDRSDFEDHMRLLAGENVNDCGKQVYNGDLEQDIRECMVEAQSSKTTAMMVRESEYGVSIESVDEQGALLVALYFSRYGVSSISRYRCNEPVPFEKGQDSNFVSSIFECPQYNDLNPDGSP